jgi:2-dehydro-3-deoxyphosphogluconate aldolase/(4S)-4-hydroxy-2-oxoglutarate aldolase
MNNCCAQELLLKAPIVPVITIHDIDNAVPLAQALIDGGLPVLEVTLRTPCALAAISRIRSSVKGAIVGAGTVVNVTDFEHAINAGSEFVITPGLTDSLLSAGAKSKVPFIPAIATVTELMKAMEFGLKVFKFFPAEAMGGTAVLQGISGPFPGVKFCPTGGIRVHNMLDYLKLPSVLSVGGSWVCPEQMIAAGDWISITSLAAEAVSMAISVEKST